MGQNEIRVTGVSILADEEICGDFSKLRNETWAKWDKGHGLARLLPDDGRWGHFGIIYAICITRSTLVMQIAEYLVYLLFYHVYKMPIFFSRQCTHTVH